MTDLHVLKKEIFIVDEWPSKLSKLSKTSRNAEIVRRSKQCKRDSTESDMTHRQTRSSTRDKRDSTGGEVTDGRTGNSLDQTNTG